MNLTSPNDVISDVISFKRTQIHIIFLSGKLTTYQCVAAALFMWKKVQYDTMLRCSLEEQAFAPVFFKR